MIQRSVRIPKSLKTRVFEIAEERGLRPGWLAKQYGFNESYMSRLKGGSAPISRIFIERSCEIFPEYDLDYLFFVEDVRQVS